MMSDVGLKFVFHPEQRPNSNISRDQNVHIYPRDATRLVARTVATPIIIVLVLVPVIICNAVEAVTTRLAIIILATSAFVTALGLLTRGHVLELVMTGAT